MINTKEKLYRQALKEVYEVIKILPEDERIKIPYSYIYNIEKTMDAMHEFVYDTNKSLSEQCFLNESKAIIVDLYVKYFSKENEQVKWEKYYKLSRKIIEEEKRKKYNPDEMFKVNEINQEESNDKEEVFLVEVKENKITYIMLKIKNIIMKILNKGNKDG